MKQEKMKHEGVIEYLDQVQKCIEFLNEFNQVLIEAGFQKSAKPIFNQDYIEMVKTLQLKLF